MVLWTAETSAEISQECVDLRSNHAEARNQHKTDNACPESRRNKSVRWVADGRDKASGCNLEAVLAQALSTKAQCRSFTSFAVLKKPRSWHPDLWVS